MFAYILEHLNINTLAVLLTGLCGIVMGLFGELPIDLSLSVGIPMTLFGGFMLFNDLYWTDE